MCKKPKMPKMPEMPAPRAQERLPQRAEVRQAQAQEMRASMGANRAPAQILGNTATMGQRRVTGLGSLMTGGLRGIVGAMGRGTSSGNSGSSLLGG